MPSINETQTIGTLIGTLTRLRTYKHSKYAGFGGAEESPLNRLVVGSIPTASTILSIQNKRFTNKLRALGSFVPIPCRWVYSSLPVLPIIAFVLLLNRSVAVECVVHGQDGQTLRAYR